MEARLVSDGVGGYSSGELHEHGDYMKMVESQKEVPRLVTKVKR
jgi:hypothetical protein